VALKSSVDRNSPSWKRRLRKIRSSAGRKGGLTTALKHCATDSNFAKTRGAKGGTSTLARYGREYFQFLANRPKVKSGWQKGKPKAKATTPFPLDKSNLAQVSV